MSDRPSLQSTRDTRKRKVPVPLSQSSSAPHVFYFVAQTTHVLSAIAFSPYASLAALRPLYGRAVAHLHLYEVVFAALLVSSLLPTVSTKTSSLVLIGLLCGAPAFLHRIAILASRTENPHIGSTLTHAAVLGPIIYFLLNVLAVGLMPASQPQTHRRLKLSLIPFLYISIKMSEPLWAFAMDFMHPLKLLIVFGCSTALLHAVSNLKIARNKTRTKIIKAIWLPFFIASAFTLLSYSQPPIHPLDLPYAHPSGLIRILSSVPSLTGQIVVGESAEHQLRYLRADHSLLGGVWMGRKVVAIDKSKPVPRDQKGNALGDSIYSTFVLQEAARFQERQTPQASALVIGLGVGISAQSFINHGLSTSVIEIDPAVYGAARQFFGLSEPHAIHIEDARSWVSRASSTKNQTFDIIVHDCFSGGGVPEHLFTLEFWSDVKMIMHPDGIIAVNFAGEINSRPAHAIFATLERSFANCKAYHDYQLDLTEDTLITEFINIVFFCTTASKPLTFRQTTDDDYLNSYLRRHILSVFSKREVLPHLLRSEWSQVLTDGNNPLGTWQEAGAVTHWKVMNGVLPSLFWETY